MNPLATIYGWAVKIKNDLYDLGFLDQIQIPSKVISIGNLTTGGTGKTPLTDLMLTHFRIRRHRAAVVSRNYKAWVRHPSRVQASEHFAASKYGDEATWLADRHPGIPVYVGPVKSQTLPYCYHREKSEIVVIDDGFQHRAAHRDFDVVLIDASAPAAEYELLPAGRMREGFQSLRRAGLVILTKIESATPERLEILRQQVGQFYRGPEIETRQVLSFPGYQDSKVLAFSGIGQPALFERALRSHYREVVFHAFPDHHNYSDSEMQKLLQESSGFDLVLTTEKDQIKLKGTALGQRTQVVTLRVEFEKGEPDFYAALDTVLC